MIRSWFDHDDHQISSVFSCLISISVQNDSKRLASGALEHILRLSEREARVENAVIFPQGKSRAYPFSGSHIICFNLFQGFPHEPAWRSEPRLFVVNDRTCLNSCDWLRHVEALNSPYQAPVSNMRTTRAFEQSQEHVGVWLFMAFSHWLLGKKYYIARYSKEQSLRNYINLNRQVKACSHIDSAVVSV